MNSLLPRLLLLVVAASSAGSASSEECHGQHYLPPVGLTCQNQCASTCSGELVLAPGGGTLTVCGCGTTPPYCCRIGYDSAGNAKKWGGCDSKACGTETTYICRKVPILNEDGMIVGHEAFCSSI